MELVRGTVILEGIHDVLPEWAALFMAAVTHLGDIWFLLIVAIGASWALEDERGRAQGPWPLAVVVGGLALLSALKYAFGMPRPELALLPVEQAPSVLRPWYETAGTTGGYAFPSGHALGTTVTFGLLAGVLDIGTRRQRIAAAATVVGLVSFSRLALGVHYPIDVVAGVLVGAAYLAAVWWLLERTKAVVDRTTVTLAVATALGVVAAIASGGAQSVLQLLALTAGAFVVWVSRTRPWSQSRAHNENDRWRRRVPSVGSMEGEGRTVHTGLFVPTVVLIGTGTVLTDSAAIVAPLFGLGVATVLLSKASKDPSLE
ncbi:phosphatase PAP2 family protein [Halobacteria archaeon AArc-m2/3/4]|uniref:Phosphatase PAP2 family protein n=1 Tax=Natronoglomus mannanivorans TaxID=2979990 RepID=A0AAP3E152_9EURY|nr:phosphatase PAP2 family protein [Halobacteria archaeon AArc-xg1-1]MCU4973580.1 phosphatase PAP2 family protein [Halobacteria archaeon AArc-m2/3/4]